MNPLLSSAFREVAIVPSPIRGSSYLDSGFLAARSLSHKSFSHCTDIVLSMQDSYWDRAPLLSRWLLRLSHNSSSDSLCQPAHCSRSASRLAAPLCGITAPSR